jgi:hypothetical protein
VRGFGFAGFYFDLEHADKGVFEGDFDAGVVDDYAVGGGELQVFGRLAVGFLVFDAEVVGWWGDGRWRVCGLPGGFEISDFGDGVSAGSVFYDERGPGVRILGLVGAGGEGNVDDADAVVF